MANNWIDKDGTLSLIPGNFTTTAKLPRGIYNITLDMQGWHLERFADSFAFNYKVYGIQNHFIEYFMKTYEHTNENMGILFNGIKGTGKTVTAKALSNRLNLPVIIVKDMGDQNQNMIEFLSSIDSDCVMFFDEFEKNFGRDDSTVLQLMDGVYNNKSRKIFMLTTNNKLINDNLLGRPSRIRYVKEFGNLELDVLKEYLNDNLDDKTKMEDVIKFVDELEISTIDILKAVVNEINIHGFDDFISSKEYLNVIISKTHMYCEYGYIYRDKCAEMKAKHKNFNLLEYFKKYSHENIDTGKKRIDRSKCEIYMDYKSVTSQIKQHNLEKGMSFDGDTILEISDDKKFILTGNEDTLYMYRVVSSYDSNIYTANSIAY